VKANHELRETARALTIIPLFVLPFTFLVVLASSIGGDRLLWNRFAVQTIAPPGLGKSEGG